jgi:DNA repair protein RecN (Recombination protein N)
MLIEVVVRDLGVIEHVSVLPGTQMTALTGETGAGKTLIVDALSLLLGGRADSMMVRAGADEARVDGRFEIDGEERVLTRVVSRAGRSRAYLDGHPATVHQLAEVGAGLVDVHGQNAHQSLLSHAAQRDALDAYGRVDRSVLIAAREAVRSIDERLNALGGDERSRMRELDLLQFQLGELDAADLRDPLEDRQLAAEESLLAGAVAHQEAGTSALAALRDEGGVRDALGTVISAITKREPFAELEQRVGSILADTDDVIAELRSLVDSIDEDPERLQEIRLRRQLLRDLLRKYGEDIEAMMIFRDELRDRVAELSSHEARAAALEIDRIDAIKRVHTAAVKVRKARLASIEPLGMAIQNRLNGLAMPKARIAVDIEPSVDAYGADEGADVRFLLAANPGSPLLPLAKVASGGELARSMLALRLALLEGRVALGGIPDTLVFDEVDAGIGGAAATAVGEALAELGEGRQVIVVTHLAQVAAKANHHVSVAKVQETNRTSTLVSVISGEQRVAEIARMLGGKADSEVGRRHAEELLSDKLSIPTARKTASTASNARPPAKKRGNVKSRG